MAEHKEGNIAKTSERSIVGVETYQRVYQKVLDAKQRKCVPPS